MPRPGSPPGVPLPRSLSPRPPEPPRSPTMLAGRWSLPVWPSSPSAGPPPGIPHLRGRKPCRHRPAAEVAPCLPPRRPRLGVDSMRSTRLVRRCWWLPAGTPPPAGSQPPTTPPGPPAASPSNDGSRPHGAGTPAHPRAQWTAGSGKESACASTPSTSPCAPAQASTTTSSRPPDNAAAQLLRARLAARRQTQAPPPPACLPR